MNNHLYDKMNYLSLPEFSDILNHELVKYINMFDLYNIDKNLMERYLLDRINLRFKQIFGDKYISFKQLLNNNNMIVSGSFILQCILGEEWQSDFDIFTDEYFPFDLYSTGETDTILDTLYKKNPNIEECYNYMNNLHMRSIINYKSNVKELPVQLICIEKSEFETYRNKSEFVEASWKYIQRNYDFDVCINTYSIIDGKENLKIYNLENICNKRINLNRVNIYTRNNRIEKYRNRGFTFDYKYKLDNSPKLFLYNDSTDVHHPIDFEEYDFEMGSYEIIDRSDMARKPKSMWPLQYHTVPSPNCGLALKTDKIFIKIE